MTIFRQLQIGLIKSAFTVGKEFSSVKDIAMGLSAISIGHSIITNTIENSSNQSLKKTLSNAATGFVCITGGTLLLNAGLLKTFPSLKNRDDTQELELYYTKPAPNRSMAPKNEFCPANRTYFSR